MQACSDNNPRFPPRFNNYTQALITTLVDEDDSHSKEQKTGVSDSSQQPSAAPMAGTPARGRGSIRGGSSGRGRHYASANAAPPIRGGGVRGRGGGSTSGRSSGSNKPRCSA